MRLLQRNTITHEQGLQITPVNTQKEFEIPSNYKKQTPWNVAHWWLYCLKEMKKTTHLTVVMQFKPAKKLLAQYEFESIMLGIRKAIGLGKYTPSLYWVIKNAEKLELKEKNGPKINDDSCYLDYIHLF